MSETGNILIQRYERRKGERETWDSHWEDIAEFVLPNSEFERKTTPGSERRERIFNNTPGEALERLVGGINSLLTNQSLKWFDFGIINFMPDEESHRWLSRARDVVLDTLNDPSVNLYATLDECYESLGGFGTGIVFTDRRDGLTFKSIPLSACYIAEDFNGIVNELDREFEFTLRQAIASFGEENMPPSVMQRLAEADNPEPLLADMHKFVQCVGPREDFNPNSLFPTEMPYYSVTIHTETKHVVKESGFRRFPYMVPRWRRGSGEKYGRSPAMTLLQDIRVLNGLSKAKLSAAMKEADPPVQMPDSGFLRPARLGPGGLNVYRSSTMGRIEPITTGARSDRAMMMEQAIEERIIRGFYNDMFQIPQNDRMTATEVIQRQQEQRQLFAPTLNRLYQELLNPIVTEGFGLAAQSGLLPEAPEQIANANMRIHYVSPLARAQRASEMGAFQEWFAAIAPMAEADPTVLDNIHPDRTAKRLAVSVSLPEEITRNEQEVNELRRERLAQQEQQQEMMAAQTAASAAKDGAQAINALRG